MNPEIAVVDHAFDVDNEWQHKRLSTVWAGTKICQSVPAENAALYAKLPESLKYPNLQFSEATEVDRNGDCFKLAFYRINRIYTLKNQRASHFKNDAGGLLFNTIAQLALKVLSMTEPILLVDEQHERFDFDAIVWEKVHREDDAVYLLPQQPIQVFPQDDFLYVHNKNRRGLLHALSWAMNQKSGLKQMKQCFAHLHELLSYRCRSKDELSQFFGDDQVAALEELIEEGTAQREGTLGLSVMPRKKPKLSHFN